MKFLVFISLLWAGAGHAEPYSFRLKDDNRQDIAIIQKIEADKFLVIVAWDMQSKRLIPIKSGNAVSKGAVYSTCELAEVFEDSLEEEFENNMAATDLTPECRRETVQNYRKNLADLPTIVEKLSSGLSKSDRDLYIWIAEGAAHKHLLEAMMAHLNRTGDCDRFTAENAVPRRNPNQEERARLAEIERLSRLAGTAYAEIQYYHSTNALGQGYVIGGRKRGSLDAIESGTALINEAAKGLPDAQERWARYTKQIEELKRQAPSK